MTAKDMSLAQLTEVLHAETGKVGMELQKDVFGACWLLAMAFGPKESVQHFAARVEETKEVDHGSQNHL